MEQLQSHIWLTASSYSIWGNICAFPHILGSPFLYMTLQLLHSEFPYLWGKFDFLFYQCGVNILGAPPLCISIACIPGVPASGCIPWVHSSGCILLVASPRCIHRVLPLDASPGCIPCKQPQGSSPGCVLWVQPLGASPGCFPGCILSVYALLHCKHPLDSSPRCVFWVHPPVASLSASFWCVPWVHSVCPYIEKGKGTETHRKSLCRRQKLTPLPTPPWNPGNNGGGGGMTVSCEEGMFALSEKQLPSAKNT